MDENFEDVYDWLVLALFEIVENCNINNKPVIGLRLVQFGLKIMLVITNWSCATRSINFVITCMISDQIELNSDQLPIQTTPGGGKVVE